MTGKIFVYGSLMTDFFNYNRLLKGKVIEREQGYVVGTLYHLKEKGYPGFITEGDTKVYGEILTLKDYDQLLKEMDVLEGYRGDFASENDYNRQRLEVRLSVSDEIEQLDVYIYNTKAFNNYSDKKVLIEHGSWRRFMDNQKLLV